MIKKRDAMILYPIIGLFIGTFVGQILAFFVPFSFVIYGGASFGVFAGYLLASRKK